MNELLSRRLLLANFVFFVLLEAVVWISGIGKVMGETARIWGGIVLVLDLLILAGPLVNRRSEVYRYLAVAVVVLAADPLSIKISSGSFLFDVGVVSYLLACVVVNWLCRRFQHRFSLSVSEWEVFFQPKNFLFTVVLWGLTLGVTVAFGIAFTRL